MESSILIAKIIGIIYLSFGIGLLLNKSYYAKILGDLLENATYMIIGGFLAIVFGFLIIEYHNVWGKSWTILITLIGWFALIKGVILLAFPKFLNRFKSMLMSEKWIQFIAPLVILFGITFIYFGFFY